MALSRNRVVCQFHWIFCAYKFREMFRSVSVTSPLVTQISPPLILIDDFPIIREIVNCGLLIANLLLASSVTLISIAIGWLWYRPLIAIALLCLAVAPFLVIKQRARNLKSNQSKCIYKTIYFYSATKILFIDSNVTKL